LVDKDKAIYVNRKRQSVKFLYVLKWFFQFFALLAPKVGLPARLGISI
jgi:hypothetical protein